MKYEFHPEAEEEFIEAAARYDANLRGLGLIFSNEVERVLELLLKNPYIGTPISSDMRHFVLNRFPFSVVYLAGDDALRVLAVAHHRRVPGYWRARRDP
jgi:hypothetical protein